MPESPSPILTAVDLTKVYQSGERRLTVLHELSFSVPRGDSCAIIGPSGSGKSTLLGLCAGLDTPSSGAVTLAGHALSDLDEDERAALRSKHIGFIFQAFQLIPTLTALENVMVPLELRGQRQNRPRATELLDHVRLGDRLDHYPAQLSGGEQQRVAIARAFVNEPDILFADEPTGNLDADTGHVVIDQLFDLNAHHGTTLVLVTHDQQLADRAHRTIRLRGGRIVSEEMRQAP